jgi:hypothetical protein
MFNQLLPKHVDNTYRGQSLAIWLFALIAFGRAAQGLGSVFRGRQVLSMTDGIPIDTYTHAAAQTVVALFGLLALANGIIAVIAIVFLFRYRALIPFMLAVFLLHQLTRYAVLRYLPIARTGTPPGMAINLVLLATTVVALGLSLWRRVGGPAPALPP